MNRFNQDKGLPRIDLGLRRLPIPKGQKDSAWTTSVDVMDGVHFITTYPPYFAELQAPVTSTRARARVLVREAELASMCRTREA